MFTGQINELTTNVLDVFYFIFIKELSYEYYTEYEKMCDFSLNEIETNFAEANYFK